MEDIPVLRILEKLMLPLPYIGDREGQPWRFQRGLGYGFLLGGDVHVFVVGGLQLQRSEALEEEFLLGDRKR